MRRILSAIILFAVFVTLFSTPQDSEAVKGISGAVTGNNANDTTFSRRDYDLGPIAGIAIWNPDAQCRVRVTYTANGVKQHPNFLFAANPEMQLIDLANVDSVYVFKTGGIQRVGVFFRGN